MQTVLDDFLVAKDAVAFSQSLDALFEDLDEEDVDDGPLGDDVTSRVDETGLEHGEQVRRTSMYVSMFDEILDTVLNGEQYLFSPEEHELFQRFRALAYPAKFLLVRLVLRKPKKWHRSDFLTQKYKRDVPDIDQTFNHLCKRPIENECIVIYDSDDEEPSTTTKPDDFFAQDDSVASLAEMLDCLRLAELKSIAKSMKVKIVDGKRAAICQALITHAASQKTIDFFNRGGALKNQNARLLALVKKITGRCVRVNHTIQRVFQRMNLVYFRGTQLTSMLLPLILSNTREDHPSHRNYPIYNFLRTSEIFPTRDDLLTYEQALELEKAIDDAFVNESRQEGAAQVLTIFKKAYTRWTQLLEELDSGDYKTTTPRIGALERFHEGHILTRVVYKGAYACGVLKRHHEEEQVLRSLLAQTRFRSGRRGAWYDRLALICMTYMGKSKDCLEEAVVVLKTGLDDPHTHLIFRPALEKRLVRLEKKLDVPADERYKATVKLKKPKSNLITGRRIMPLREASIISVSEQPSSSKPKTKAADKRGKTPSGKENKTVLVKSTGKSIWKGKDGEVTVEEFALEHYATLGYKGFHCEGRILLHLYTLLMWPVLFETDVPGAFETPFQTCPLDLVHDSFFPTRQQVIMKRISLIEDGFGLDFIRETDERERPKKTWAVGVRWDDFSLQDALEIAEGLDGPGLGKICLLLSEEYGCRASGVPDLIIWKADEKKAMFVEVKGPGDQLRENQRVWIDVMIRHNIAVEVCRVENWDYNTSSGKSKKSVKDEEDDEEDDVEIDYEKMDAVKQEREASASVAPSRKRRRDAAD